MTQSSQDLFSLLKSSLKIGQWLWQPVDHNLQLDSQCQTLLGCENPNFTVANIGEFWLKTCHQKDSAALVEAFDKLFDANISIDIEYRSPSCRTSHHIHLLAVAKYNSEGVLKKWTQLVRHKFPIFR